ncbi:hypothetical protein C8F01DRAFT_1086509 [Mycena amicta]|nr:hypothetical protein C8F01DRAFT_1086509 [Mycena amicta]
MSSKPVSFRHLLHLKPGPLHSHMPRKRSHRRRMPAEYPGVASAPFAELSILNGASLTILAGVSDPLPHGDALLVHAGPPGWRGTTMDGRRRQQRNVQSAQLGALQANSFGLLYGQRWRSHAGTFSDDIQGVDEDLVPFSLVLRRKPPVSTVAAPPQLPQSCCLNRASKPRIRRMNGGVRPVDYGRRAGSERRSLGCLLPLYMEDDDYSAGAPLVRLTRAMTAPMHHRIVPFCAIGWLYSNPTLINDATKPRRSLYLQQATRCGQGRQRCPVCPSTTRPSLAFQVVLPPSWSPPRPLPDPASYERYVATATLAVATQSAATGPNSPEHLILSGLGTTRGTAEIRSMSSIQAAALVAAPTCTWCQPNGAGTVA